MVAGSEPKVCDYELVKSGDMEAGVGGGDERLGPVRGSALSSSRPAADMLAARLPALACLLLAPALADAFHYNDCGSTTGVFSKVSISECDPPTGNFCGLKRGTNATLKIEFIPNEGVTSLKAVVHGILGGVPIPFAIPNSDGCKDSGLTCPLLMGKEYNYTASLPVKTTYPSVRVTVRWELKDEKMQDIICIELPAKLI